MMIEHVSDPMSRDEVFMVRLSSIELNHFQGDIAARVAEIVAQRVAAQYLEQHGVEVLA